MERFFENGGVSQRLTYVGETPEGPYTLFHPSGRVREQGTYHGGKLSGRVVGFDDSGTKVVDMDYSGGEAVRPAFGDLRPHDLSLDAVEGLCSRLRLHSDIASASLLKEAGQAP